MIQFIKNLFRAFFSLKVFAHIVTILCLFIFIIVIVRLVLNVQTRNGEFVEVPNIEFCTLEEAAIYLESYGLDYSVVDSTIQNKYLDGGTVVDFFPVSGSKVKPDRKIALTLTSTSVGEVVLPNLEGRTYKDAKQIIKNLDLKLGTPVWLYYIAKNEVLSARLPNKKKIKRFQRVKVGTPITLYVGAGLSKEKRTIPNLIGMTANEARSALLRLAFYTGQKTYRLPKAVDSTQARVIKQYPLAGSQYPMGSIVDLWMGIPQATTEPNDTEI